MSGEVMAISKYKHVTSPTGRPIVQAIEKYNVHSDFVNVMLDRLFGEDNDVQPLLVKVATGAELADAERLKIGRFANVLADDIEFANSVRTGERPEHPDFERKTKVG